MHRIRDIAPCLAVLSGWLGLTTHIVGLVDPALLPLAARTFLVGLPSAMLVFAAVQMLARPGMEAETAAPQAHAAYLVVTR